MATQRSSVKQHIEYHKDGSVWAKGGKIGGLTWIARVFCLSVILAMCDSWTATEYRRTFFSTNSWKLKDGGSTGHNGFRYSLVYWRSMDGTAYGPEVWFWFTPLVVDAAHKNMRIRLLWQDR